MGSWMTFRIPPAIISLHGSLRVVLTSENRIGGIGKENNDTSKEDNACSHLNGGGKIIFFDISGFYCSDLIANILREDCKKYVS